MKNGKFVISKIFVYKLKCLGGILKHKREEIYFWVGLKDTRNFNHLIKKTVKISFNFSPYPQAKGQTIKNVLQVHKINIFFCFGGRYQKRRVYFFCIAEDFIINQRFSFHKNIFYFNLWNIYGNINLGISLCFLGEVKIVNYVTVSLLNCFVSAWLENVKLEEDTRCFINSRINLMQTRGLLRKSRH